MPLNTQEENREHSPWTTDATCFCQLLTFNHCDWRFKSMNHNTWLNERFVFTVRISENILDGRCTRNAPILLRCITIILKFTICQLPNIDPLLSHAPHHCVTDSSPQFSIPFAFCRHWQQVVETWPIKRIFHLISTLF